MYDLVLEFHFVMKQIVLKYSEEFSSVGGIVYYIHKIPILYTCKVTHLEVSLRSDHFLSESNLGKWIKPGSLTPVSAYFYLCG